MRTIKIELETQGQWRGMWVVTFHNGLRVAYTTEDEAIQTSRRRR